MTHLRQLMLDELERRNYSPNTVRSYLHAVEEFARHFRRSPEQLGPDHVREYQVHLFRNRKLSARTIAGQTAALRFLFVKTLRRPYLPDALPFPKHSRRLPTVLSQEEVARLIDASGNLMHRAMVMTLYATGVRRAELCRLKVADIDSERMVLHIHEGKRSSPRTGSSMQSRPSVEPNTFSTILPATPTASPSPTIASSASRTIESPSDGRTTLRPASRRC
ncbi:Mobile element protein [Acidisarcina polymorpha]|uniref:Mobile element protein n=1 Tax=Acidisarcina polymorpha TaxID=2211140 RepID=A0A2Z5FYY6_9BACT|nr:Mobile element protein [Acidisarcina polymorpha]